MAMTINCPSCQKALRVSEEYQGKKMRCAACQQVFQVPLAPPPPPGVPEPGPSGGGYNEDPAPPPPPPRHDDDEPPRRPRDDDDDRDRRRDDYADRRRDDYDRPRRDDDYDRPRRDDDYDRPRRRYDDDYRRPSSSGGGGGALTCGILSLVLCCIPIIGFALGVTGINLANKGMAGMRHNDPARGTFQIAKVLSIIGICLSGVVVLLACLMRMADAH
jgi:predicted Zn finger-like uncharacterized protein